MWVTHWHWSFTEIHGINMIYAPYGSGFLFLFQLLQNDVWDVSMIVTATLIHSLELTKWWLVVCKLTRGCRNNKQPFGEYCRFWMNFKGFPLRSGNQYIYFSASSCLGGSHVQQRPIRRQFLISSLTDTQPPLQSSSNSETKYRKLQDLTVVARDFWRSTSTVLNRVLGEVWTGT